jgi:hypothetical protein
VSHTVWTFGTTFDALDVGVGIGALSQYWLGSSEYEFDIICIMQIALSGVGDEHVIILTLGRILVFPRDNVNVQIVMLI